MYSPKISEDLIPTLYRISKDRGKPMTKIVDEILREKLTSTQLNIDNDKPSSSQSKVAEHFQDIIKKEKHPIPYSNYSIKKLTQ